MEQKQEEAETSLIDPIINNPFTPPPKEDDSKGFTNAFQVLAMHYIFEELEVPMSRTVEAKMRFIKMLTGKNADKIKEIINSPLDYKEPKGQKEDLTALIKYFEDLKLPKVVEKINKDFRSITSKK